MPHCPRCCPQGGPRGCTGTHRRFSSGRPRKAPGWTVLIRLFFRSLQGDRHGSWGVLWGAPSPGDAAQGARTHPFHPQPLPWPPKRCQPPARASLAAFHPISLSLSLPGMQGRREASQGDASPWGHSGCPCRAPGVPARWHWPRIASGAAASRRVISCVQDKDTAPDGLGGPREARLSN